MVLVVGMDRLSDDVKEGSIMCTRYDSEEVGTALPAQQYKVKKIGERAPLVIRFIIQFIMCSKIHYSAGINL